MMIVMIIHDNMSLTATMSANLSIDADGNGRTVEVSLIAVVLACSADAVAIPRLRRQLEAIAGVEEVTALQVWKPDGSWCVSRHRPFHHQPLHLTIRPRSSFRVP